MRRSSVRTDSLPARTARLRTLRAAAPGWVSARQSAKRPSCAMSSARAITAAEAICEVHKRTLPAAHDVRKAAMSGEHSPDIGAPSCCHAGTTIFLGGCISSAKENATSRRRTCQTRQRRYRDDRRSCNLGIPLHRSRGSTLPSQVLARGRRAAGAAEAYYKSEAIRSFADATPEIAVASARISRAGRTMGDRVRALRSRPAVW